MAFTATSSHIHVSMSLPLSFCFCRCWRCRAKVSLVQQTTNKCKCGELILAGGFVKWFDYLSPKHVSSHTHAHSLTDTHTPSHTHIHTYTHTLSLSLPPLSLPLPLSAASQSRNSRVFQITFFATPTGMLRIMTVNSITRRPEFCLCQPSCPSRMSAMVVLCIDLTLVNNLTSLEISEVSFILFRYG